MNDLSAILAYRLREIIADYGSNLVHAKTEFGASEVSFSVAIVAPIKGEDHRFILALHIDPEDEEGHNSGGEG